MKRAPLPRSNSQSSSEDRVKKVKYAVSKPVRRYHKSSFAAYRQKILSLLKKLRDSKRDQSRLDNNHVSSRRLDPSPVSSGKQRNESNYGSQEYWESRYEKGQDIQQKFEWFVSYNDIEPILQGCMDYNDRTGLCIDVGCGTSMFLRDLRRGGYKGRCLGLDYSEKAIETMKLRKDCTGIDFNVCDATKMDEIVKGASVIVDKSLMDTLLHAEDEELVPRMLQAAARSLKPDGIFISVTQLNPHKPKDQAFLRETIAPNLKTSNHGVSSIEAHRGAGDEEDEDTLIPTVLICRFSAQNEENSEESVEFKIVEYESGDEDDENASAE